MEITPRYYASGTYQQQYRLKGSGFSALPNNAVAVIMVDNDNPLEQRYSQSESVAMRMTRVSDVEVEFAMTITSQHRASSIGAILSNNRNVVYWVNETRPIP